MRRILVAIVGVVAIAGMTSGAWAASPNFHYANYAVAQSGSTAGQLSVSFKQTGLGTTMTYADYTLTANYQGVWECVNGGIKNPSASNKTYASGTVSTGPVAFPIRNGQTTGTLTAPFPAPPTGWSCPNGQHVTNVSVVYTNVQLLGPLSTAAPPAAGTVLSYVNPNAP